MLSVGYHYDKKGEYFAYNVNGGVYVYHNKQPIIFASVMGKWELVSKNGDNPASFVLSDRTCVKSILLEKGDTIMTEPKWISYVPPMSSWPTTHNLLHPEGPTTKESNYSSFNPFSVSNKVVRLHTEMPANQYISSYGRAFSYPRGG